MVQPMAKRPQQKHDLHKQKPSMLEAQTFLSLLLTAQVKFTNPNLYIEPEGVRLHSTAEAFKTLLKSKPVIIMPEGESQKPHIKTHNIKHKAKQKSMRSLPKRAER